jgi:hypothetical protein
LNLKFIVPEIKNSSKQHESRTQES